MIDLTASRQSAGCGIADERREKWEENAEFLRPTPTLKAPHSLFRMFRSRWIEVLRWRGKILAAVRLSLGQ